MTADKELHDEKVPSVISFSPFSSHSKFILREGMYTDLCRTSNRVSRDAGFPLWTNDRSIFNLQHAYLISFQICCTVHSYLFTLLPLINVQNVSIHA